MSANVRARVQAAARELGYRPNALAQTLISRRSNVIAILMTTNTNSHFPEVLSELSHSADAHRLRVMLFTVDNPAMVSDVIDQILAYQVDAVLSLTELAAADARTLESQGVALVLYNRMSAAFPANLVSCDHHEAGYVLGQHLLELGHRKFGMIAGPKFSSLAIDRAKGFVAALDDAKIQGEPLPVEIGDFSYESGRLAVRALLLARPQITALVCINDLMAIGAIDEATANGRHVPDDLSVASFDGVPSGTWGRYRLTTMKQPLPQLAEAALETIVRLLAKPDLARETRLLACTLEIGHSSQVLKPAEI